MNKTLAVVSSAAVCLGGLATLATAQAPVGTERPKILQIFVEETKPGRGAAHEKIEKSWADASRRGGDKSYYLGMVSGNQAWFLFPRVSFAAIEQADKEVAANAALTADVERIQALDGDVLAATSSMWATYRPDLSYRSEWDVAKMRNYQITVTRLNPGYGRDFDQFRKITNEAHDKLKMDERWTVYQVMAGAPAGTYIIFQPMASLADLDKGAEMHGKAYQEALGEASRDWIRDFQRAGVKSSETLIFNYSPKMSYLPKEFTDRDPEFWAPKPPAAPKKDEKK